MYICDNCGALITSPISIHEYHDELEDKPIEEYHGCPYCKSDQVVEARQCSLCGEYTAHDYIVLADGSIVCDNCYVMHQ